MSLCHYYFVLFAWRTFRREHTSAGFDPHTAAAAGVCMRKNCIEYYDEGKIFLFNLFSSLLSLLFAEKPKSERKSWFFFTTHKTFRFNFAFRFRNNPFLSCFRTHFPNPVRKTFFQSLAEPAREGGTQKENSFTALNMDRGRKCTALNWTVRKLVADWLGSDEGEREESERFSLRKEILATPLSGTNTDSRQFSTMRETRKQAKGCLPSWWLLRESGALCVCVWKISCSLSREGK